jgi:peptidyl-tRNA hydrolase
MPLYMDVHNLPGATAQAVADAHMKDLEEQGKHGVKYLRYWVNEAQGKVFCLVDAPDAEAANTVHREAHGLVADEVYEVSEGS